MPRRRAPTKPSWRRGTTAKSFSSRNRTCEGQRRGGDRPRRFHGIRAFLAGIAVASFAVFSFTRVDSVWVVQAAAVAGVIAVAFPGP